MFEFTNKFLSSRSFVMGLWSLLFVVSSLLVFRINMYWCWVYITCFYTLLSITHELLYRHSCSKEFLKGLLRHVVTTSLVWLTVLITLKG